MFIDLFFNHELFRGWFRDFPGGTVNTNLPASARDTRFDVWSGKILDAWSN